MAFAIHVGIVSGNVCTKFHVNILNGSWEMAMVQVFAQISNSKKGHNSINIKSRVMPLAIHVHIVSGNVCTKVHSNILTGFWVMDHG